MAKPETHNFHCYCYFLFILMTGFAYSQSIKKLDSLRNELEEQDDFHQKAKTLSQLVEGWAALNFDSAFTYVLQMKAVAASSDDPSDQVLYYRMRGVNYGYSYQLDSAAYYYQKALDLAYHLGDSTSIATCSFNLGTNELVRGNYLKVLPLYEKALDFLQEVNDNKIILFKIYNNLGIVYRRIDRPAEAITIYRRTMAILDPKVDKERLTYIYINMGNALNTLNHYDSAVHYYQKGLDYSIEENDLHNYYFAINGLGMVAEERGNLEEAASYFRQVAKAKEMPDQYVVFSASRFLGSILSRLGKYDSAMYYFNKAALIYSEQDYPHEVKELHLDLANHYEKVGQINSALEYYKKYLNQKEQLINQEVIDRTAEWEERFEAQEKEKEIINLKLKNEAASLLAQQQTNQRNIFISISAGLILFAGFTFYMYRLKQRVNSSLAEKNTIINKALADKELLMKEIHHRVKNNLQVISSLLNLQSNFISDEKANAAVLESKNRVHSMALIHQRLYQHENLTEIDLEDYLDQLINNLEQSYHRKDQHIDIHLETDKISMDVDKVILIGLIINELVTNSFKYAFEGLPNGVIDVSLKQQKKEMTLIVSDNGKGMDGPPKVKQGSLGTLLIHDLSKKLNALLEYDLSMGTKVILRF